jgi:hypothetical protein
MNKWLNTFLEQPDISDRFDSSVNMSDLSGYHQGLLDQNLENISRTCTDNTDRFKTDPNISVLSVPFQDPFDEESLLYDFEERLAIAEYDGEQTPVHAQKIAYLDGFISISSNLGEDAPHKDWLAQKIQIAFKPL